MKNPPLNLLKLFLVRTITVFLVASDRRFAYAKGVHPHGELAVEGYKSQQAHSPQGLFLCVKSLCSRISMVKLERDTFKCTGHLLSLSSNPFQLCHPHLEVIGKAPLVQQERINHA